MMSVAFDLEQPTVEVSDGSRFPVRRIFCVGKNYADHAREMGGDPEREPPFFFAKPADAVVMSGVEIPYPPRTANLHHEVELVLAIGKNGANISAEAALEYIVGYAVGNDLTRRDLQADAKAAGRPWDMAKGFDRSAVVSPLRLVREIGHPEQAGIWLSVNGVSRQDGDIADMIWPIREIVAELSTYVALKAGDLIFTGTPSGVGKIEQGDLVEAGVEGVGVITNRFA